MLFEPAPLLDEAHEGSDSCPRADHNHWVGGLEGQPELRLSDVHGNGGLVAVVCDQFVLQPVGGDSLVNAASLGFVLHHYCTDVDAVGVNLQRGGELQTGLSSCVLQPTGGDSAHFRSFNHVTFEEEAIE